MFLPFSSPNGITRVFWGNVLRTYTPAPVHVYTGETHRAIRVGGTRFVMVLGGRSQRISRLCELRYRTRQRKDLSASAQGVKAAGAHPAAAGVPHTFHSRLLFL